ncbi:tyrosyl-DNA phosphodiesterase 2 isoform X1 [Hydra vulgaris]
MANHDQVKDNMPLPWCLKVLSWNIDGLDDRCFDQRASGICSIINTHYPDVVMLQEVLDEHLVIFEQFCQKYSFFPYKNSNYFNMIMLKKDINIVMIKFNPELFKNSKMDRSLLKCEILFYSHPFLIMTTHLESLSDNSVVRIEQMSSCLETILKTSLSNFVIFAGDLNIREHELKSINCMFAKDTCNDAWESAGKDSSKRFTWDVLLNDNKSFQGKYPRARYDRMYYRDSNKIQAIVSAFELVGTHRDKCGLFPSDHFGILVSFLLNVL